MERDDDATAWTDEEAEQRFRRRDFLRGTDNATVFASVSSAFDGGLVGWARDHSRRANDAAPSGTQPGTDESRDVRQGMRAARTDGEWCDAVARLLAAGQPRRRILKSLLGGAAGGALALLGVRRRADATHGRPAGATCLTGSQCASGLCDPRTRRCACAEGQSNCGGACVDRQTDATNCGACDRICSATTCRAAVCEGGICGTVPDPAQNGLPCDDGDPCTAGDTC